MMDYQEILVADGSHVGDPAPLPPQLIGLSDATLADLSAAIDPTPAAFVGRGFLPVSPDPEPDPVPAQVYAVQLLEQIRRDGRMDAVNAYVAGAGEDVQLWFTRAYIVRRANAMLIAGWTALGLTSDQLDATFRAAALIPL